MASLKDHGPSWSSTLEEKCVKEERRLHVRLTKVLHQHLASLLESGAEADICLPYVDGSVWFHSCLVRIRLPKFWEVLQNEHDRTLICETVDRDKLLQILRYIYTEDDLDPVLLTVDEITSVVSKSYVSSKPVAECDNVTVHDTLSEVGNLPDLVSGHIPSGSSQTADEQLSHTAHNGTNIKLQNSEKEKPHLTDQSEYEGIQEPLQLDRNGDSVNNNHVASTQEEDNNAEGVSKKEELKWTGSVRSYCQLGKDLLHLYQTSTGSNIKIKVKDTCLDLHRCILCVRSSYFGSMLGGQWRESEALEINLEGINAIAMCQALVYIYGGIPDVNYNDSNLIELITIADMYGLEGLKDIISFSIKKACHFFHKPCNDCIPCVLSILPTAEMFGLDELWDKGRQWCSRYVSRVWSAKQFATLPTEIQDKCLQATLADITNDSVIDLVLECDRLGGSLTNVRRSEPVIAMAAQLMDACIDHLKNNLVEITRTEKFLSLGNHMALGLDFLDDVFCRAVITMPTNKACATYVRVSQLCTEAETEQCPWTHDFKQLVRHLEEKCEHFMRLYINQLINTDDWKNMLSAELQERVKEGAWYVCVGDGRRMRGPPRGACYRGTSMATGSGKVRDVQKSKDKLKTSVCDTKKNTSFRSSSVTMKRKEDLQHKVSRPKRLSSLPHSKWRSPDEESRSQSCTFKAVKMADDVLMSHSEVQRVKPVVRKSSSSEPNDDESHKVKHDGEFHRQMSRQQADSSLKSFPSSGATVNTSLVSPTSDIDDSDEGNVFLSPEKEYVLIPPTVVQSVEVEAIQFPSELVVLYLEWDFVVPESQDMKAHSKHSGKS